MKPQPFTGVADLNLSPLDREVFVVLAINMDPFYPEAIAGADTSVSASLTSTSQTRVTNLSNPNCLAAAVNSIKAAGFTDSGCAFQTRLETPQQISITSGSLLPMTSSFK